MSQSTNPTHLTPTIADRIAIVYDRASDPKQRDNYSRADAARLSRLADERGWRWELRQEIKSGEELQNRPVMLGILREIEAGTVRAIIVQDSDRLSRDEDGIDGRMIRRCCRDNGCLVVTPSKVFDYTTEADDDQADFEFLRAKWYKRDLVKKTMIGMKEAARQGKTLPGRVPVGYDAVYTPSERPDKRPIRNFAINGDEAALIRRIFDLAERHSECKAAAIMNEEGWRWPVKSKALQEKYGRTERPFVASTIRDVITNELYAGFQTWGKVCRSRHLRDFEETRHFRPDLQIISIEQWNRLQRVRQERRPTNLHPGAALPARSISSRYLFSGLIKCRHCGAAMSGYRQSHGVPAYMCSVRSGGGTLACAGQSVAESVARAALITFLQDLFAERIALEPFIADAARRSGGKTEEDLAQEIQASMAVVARQKANLVEAVASGALSASDVKAKRMDLEEQRERLERRLTSLGTRQEMRTEIAAAARLIDGEGLAARVALLPDQALQRLARLIFRRMTFDGTGRGRHRQCHVSTYDFTPEFADFLEHHGTHTAADDFTAYSLP